MTEQLFSTLASDPVLTLEGVHLQLSSDAGSVQILRGIDLTVKAGDTVGVVGPSGSGKTSLLMVIAGLEKVTGGRITAAGTEVSGLDEDSLARFRRDHVGIVFQNFHLVTTMSALENVALPLEFAGLGAGGEDAFGRARTELEAVGLGHRLSHYPGQLSGGEQQRVALARAFVTGPKILLADEPTGSLDQATGDGIIDLLFQLQVRVGTTLILVTHAPELASRCTRIVRLADGRIVDASMVGNKGGPDEG